MQVQNSLPSFHGCRSDGRFLNVPAFTPRQRREIEYHRGHAERHRDRADEPVSLDVVSDPNRRWWNAYWSTYDILRGHDLSGARILVPGCGFAEDAIRLSHMGAEVHAFDISQDILEIAKARAVRQGYPDIQFARMSVENTEYEDSFFDFVVCLDILHHVDIPAAAKEFRRILKPAGHIVGDELYTHGAVERNVRQSRLVKNVLYPRMVRFIYGSEKPYITDDEHKIDDREFAILLEVLSSCHVDYFNIFVGRLFPGSRPLSLKCDRLLAKGLGGFSRFIAGRVVFDGIVAK